MSPLASFKTQFQFAARKGVDREDNGRVGLKWEGEHVNGMGGCVVVVRQKFERDILD